MRTMRLALHFIAACILSGAAAASYDEPLQRRAYFGLGGEPRSDGPGLALTFVDEAATAGAVGLQVGDVLLAVNKDAVETMADLVAVAATMRAGDFLTFHVLREDQERLFLTNARERPREAADGLIVEYADVAIDDGRSRTIVYKPAGDGPFPALFYLPGFSCASLDFGGGPDDTIRRFVEDVARAGFLVMRQEKHGVGDSLSKVPCDEIDFNDEVAAFAAGYDALAARADVDPSAIFLFGHSLGGVVAPALTRAAAPAGVAVYGAPSRRWFAYKLDVFNEQPAVLGRDPARARKKADIGIPYMRDVMTTDLPWSEIEARHPEAITAKIHLTEGDQILGRDFRFLRTLNGFDVEAAWRRYEGAVLSLHGSYDVHVISDKDAKNLVRLVNEEGRGRADLVVLDGAEHGLSRIDGPRDAYAKTLLAGGWTASKALAAYDPRIAQETVAWMNRVRRND